jgi:hypothetical protein
MCSISISNIALSMNAKLTSLIQTSHAPNGVLRNTVARALRVWGRDDVENSASDSGLYMNFIVRL